MTAHKISKIYTAAERARMERSAETIGDYRVHPAASAFPLIQGAEFKALVEDIRANGLLDPIWATALPDEDDDGEPVDPDEWRFHECIEHDRTNCHDCHQWLGSREVDEIIDGRNRLRACLEAGVDPTFRRYEGDDPVAFVVSTNIHRRHLDESQRGMIAARLARLPKGSNQHAPIGAPSKSEAASLLNVGTKTVERGRAVLERGVPELAEAVDRGEVAISRAAEIAKLPADEQRREIDPAYGNKRVAGTVSGAEDYESDEWYTPLDVVEAAREVLGEIDLDPATCDFAQGRIKARRFFTRDDDGLAQEWSGRVWLNPPYSPKLARDFADKLLAELKAGRVTSAVMIQNASTDTGWFHALASEGAICLTRGRINFDREDGRGSQNRYGQVMFYFGRDQEKFEQVFARFGLVGRLYGAK